MDKVVQNRLRFGASPSFLLYPAQEVSFRHSPKDERVVYVVLCANYDNFMHLALVAFLEKGLSFLCDIFSP